MVIIIITGVWCIKLSTNTHSTLHSPQCLYDVYVNDGHVCNSVSLSAFIVEPLTVPDMQFSIRYNHFYDNPQALLLLCYKLLLLTPTNCKFRKLPSFSLGFFLCLLWKTSDACLFRASRQSLNGSTQVHLTMLLNDDGGVIRALHTLCYCLQFV